MWKLASVAFFLGAQADPPLKLELFPEDLAKARGAQCLDHSPAGYYIRKQDPSKWVIFLEGGGLCVEVVDCQARRSTHEGSSRYWKNDSLPERPSTASLSELNPFATWSHVWVPYCSGDTWLGNSAEAHPSLLGLQMSGHIILETLVERLMNTTQMSSATDVVLSGSSAGGIGTFHHTDWLAETLASHASATGAAAPRVTGFPIEGVFFPEKWPVLFEQFAIGNKAPLSGFASKYLALLQDPWFQPACVAAAKREGFKSADCFDVSRLMPYTKQPLFVTMNLFDKLLIQDLGACFSCQETDGPQSMRGRFTRFYGTRMNETILDINRSVPQTGWFVPSEFHHDENFYEFMDSKEKKIGGVSLRSAFEAWYSGKRVVLVEPTCNEDGPCVRVAQKCATMEGDYVEATRGMQKRVTVVQDDCNVRVDYGGQLLSGSVDGRSMRIASFRVSGAVQANGDISFVNGSVWLRRFRTAEATVVV